MYRVFENIEDFNTFTENGEKLTSGDVYYIESEDKVVLQTNNIDGTEKTFDLIEPTGNIEITENGEDIDVAQYASATVAVPQPSGNISITENGTNIDVNDYATASVNVAPNLTTQNITENGTYQPSGNYDGFSSVTVAVPQPTGNISITENGTNINVNDYATASVNVTPNLTTQNITQNGTYEPSGNYDGFSSVTVAVPQPTGNIEITENGEGINIAQYATATVNVDAPAKDYIVEGTEYNPTATYSGVFKPQKHIVTANIPSGFTSIGSGAFQSCPALKSITIPDSVTSISEYAFVECTGLTSVTIPNSVTSIGDGAFQRCSSLTSITIPDSVTSIGGNAFQRCSSLTSITIPEGVTSISGGAFGSCTSLTSITIPDSVTSIGYYAFEYCSGLTSITINATTPPTLSDSNAFRNTNNCPIYVPAESVEAYKTATNWNSLASRIQAITE